VRNSAWLTYDYLEMDWFTVPQREGRHEHEHEHEHEEDWLT